MSDHNQIEPQYHDLDKQAAMKRAKALGGIVVLSKSPETLLGFRENQTGYWSDAPDTMLRPWETLIWSPPA